MKKAPDSDNFFFIFLLNNIKDDKVLGLMPKSFAGEYLSTFFQMFLQFSLSFFDFVRSRCFDLGTYMFFVFGVFKSKPI